MSIEAFIPDDPRHKIKRAWVAAVSKRSGDPADFDLGIEIDCPEGTAPILLRTTRGRNQIVLSIQFSETPKE